MPTEFVNSLPNDYILRAAATWAEAIDVLTRERDANWLVVRYEELIANPPAVISKLYNAAGLEDEAGARGAIRLPEPRVRDFSQIKYQMMGHPYRAEVFSLLEERAWAMGYSADLSTLPGSGLRYAAETWISPFRKQKKRKAGPKQIPLLARA